MSTRRARSISKELSGAKLGDMRLSARLEAMAEGVMSRPGASLPQQMGDEAGLEGAYRFVNNERVDARAIVAPHIAATAQRVAAVGGAYCISDTTELRFGGEDREGLGPLQGGGQGFHVHLGLAVSKDGSRLPLGLLGLDVLVRPEQPKRRRKTKKSRNAADSESRKWLRVAEAAEEAVDGRAALIHLMDREADIYALLSSFASRGSRFIVRVAQNRNVSGDDEDTVKLFDALDTGVELGERQVPLSRRTRPVKPHPGRAERSARLTFASKQLVVQRPKTAAKTLPESHCFNFVHVYEKHPPKGEAPIDWKLVTSEPISTEQEIESVIDGYRTRWVIEEYNKAIKSGCRIERSQLESLEAIVNLLAIVLPVASQLLALRSLAILNGSALALGALTRTQLEALRLMSKARLGDDPTAQQALLAVAGLGGHLKNNGPPGWLVLHRGFQDLLRYAAVLEAQERRAKM